MKTLRDLGNSLIVAFSMYSKIPMPRADWTDDTMKYAMCFFPWIGWVIGALDALWLYLSSAWGLTLLLRAAVFTAIPILVTGGIHLDGFLDTSDAMSSWREREKRLEILKDSHTGAFAIINAGLWFVLFFGFAAQLAARVPGVFLTWREIWRTCTRIRMRQKRTRFSLRRRKTAPERSADLLIRTVCRRTGPSS